MKGRNSKVYGEDSYHVGEFTTHYIKTMQVEDEKSYIEAATTSKRLAYGNSSGCINTASIKGGLNYIFDNLGAPYIRAFRDSDPLSLMVSYAAVGQVSMSANKYMLHKVLRGVMGFTGLIMSGAIALPHLYTRSRVAKSHEDAGLEALHAGLQHEVNTNGSAAFPSLINSASEVDVAHMVDEAVKAVLEMRFMTGVFDFPLPSVDALEETLRSDRHLDIHWNVSR
ncbi:glycoside hydrolase superfamily [Xylaria sp. FL0064]|nr:glycoside hydrolase superfamily [Xylaria sp. FL0064]